MNTQRWIALGIFILAVACIATSNLWLAPLLEEDEEPTPTPTLEAAENDEGLAEDEGNPLTPTPEPTLDPTIVEILAELGIETQEIGFDPFIIRAGSFEVIDNLHRGEGSAFVYQLSEGQYALRLDPFTVTNGPDLRLILSEHETPRTSSEALLPTYIDLGPLKNPTGAQNYEIPEGVDITQFNSAVIYSTSLNMVYTTATLVEVRGQ